MIAAQALQTLAVAAHAPQQQPGAAGAHSPSCSVGGTAIDMPIIIAVC